MGQGPVIFSPATKCRHVSPALQLFRQHGEAPRQSELDTHARLHHIDASGHPLPERASGKIKSVAFPPLINSEHSGAELFPYAAKALLKPLPRLCSSELVSNFYDDGLRHRIVNQWGALA